MGDIAGFDRPSYLVYIDPEKGNCLCEKENHFPSDNSIKIELKSYLFLQEYIKFHKENSPVNNKEFEMSVGIVNDEGNYQQYAVLSKKNVCQYCNKLIEKLKEDKTLDKKSLNLVITQMQMVMSRVKKKNS